MQAAARVLLVEDNADDVALFFRALGAEPCGADVVVARDGRAALECLLAVDASGAASVQLPAVVFLDVSLPKFDGFEVLKQLRADERTRLVPVVLLSSAAPEEDVQRAYALGANGYVQKSVHFEQYAADLRLLTEYWLRLNEPPRSASTAESKGPFREERFLFELDELLRTATEPVDMLRAVSKRLGEFLGGSRCLFCDTDAGVVTIYPDYHVELPSLAGVLALSPHMASQAELAAGRSVVDDDMSADHVPAQGAPMVTRQGGATETRFRPSSFAR